MKEDIELSSRNISEIKNKRYEIISLTYKSNFSICTILILDNKSGKIKKEIFNI